MPSLQNIIRQHLINFCCLADDTYLYLPIKPDESDQLTKPQACLKNVKACMSNNFLSFNSDKTEVIVLGSKQHGNTSNYITTVNDLTLWG